MKVNLKQALEEEERLNCRAVGGGGPGERGESRQEQLFGVESVNLSPE